LSKDVIRVWERRYGIVQPSRGANRYRTYTDEEVALLRYLKRQMDQGQSIGNLAAMGREHLMKAAAGAARSVAAALPPYERVLHELIELLDPLDKASFERRLNGAVAVVPFDEALHGILLPLQQRIGDLWHEGKVSVAVEHYVTNHVRQKLFTAMNQLPIHEQGPRIILACPPGEYHEVGALAAAYICASRGCRTYYLGANVPFDELAALCRHIDPHLILLSLIAAPAPEEEARLMQGLRDLAATNRPIVLGGAAARLVTLPDHSRNIEIMTDLADLERRLTLFSTDHASRFASDSYRSS
jgi:DNA-binding transcriptional MerR regulator/methylmalonyl-CoA mutase cobalamin-binding subunit